MSLPEEKRETFGALNNDNQLRSPRTEQIKMTTKKESLDHPLGFKHLRRKTIYSSTPSNESHKSWKSVDYPLNFKRSSFSGFGQNPGKSPTASTVSLRSEKLKDYPINYKSSSASGFGQKTGNYLTPSIVSLKSTRSRDYPLNFKSSSASGFGQKTGNSLTPSIVSLKSTKSRDYPLNFNTSSASGFGQKTGNYLTPSIVSLKSTRSRDYPLNFKSSSASGSDQKVPEEPSSFHKDLHSDFERLERETLIFVRSKLNKFYWLLAPNCPKPLWRQDEDMLRFGEGEKILSGEEEKFMNFLQEFLRMMKHGDLADALSSRLSMMNPSKEKDEPQVSKFSKDTEIQLKAERTVQKAESYGKSLGFQHNLFSGNKLRPLCRTPQMVNMESVLENLDGNIATFVEKELKGFHKLLDPKHFHSQDEDEEVVNWAEEEETRITKEAFLNMILESLRRMKQEELAFALQNKSAVAKCQRTLKSNLKTRLAYVFEGITKGGHPALLNKIFTELYITEGDPVGVNNEHEVKLIENALRQSPKPIIIIRCEDIFTPIRSDKPIKIVMTEGVAGIGKTVLTQKFVLDWAEGTNNQDIHFTFLFSFRGLNMLKEKKLSLVELIHLFFPEIKEGEICRFEHYKVLFIFDGLDECRIPLNLKTDEVLINVTEPTSLDVLLVNLIRGRLLPSALIWITTRPAAAHQIPPEFVDLVTEIRGFNEIQKEEYFRQRFAEEEESKMVISHIKSSRSLYIMCHIPVFCWITATVLEDAFKARKERDLPNSLTEMYILFLVVLSKVKNVKYDKGAEKETREIIQSLGKLAFRQLMKGNLVFYESDLTECGIDVRAASVYSGVFTEIFQEEGEFFDQNMFCFVHLSVQEFLAALHVHLTFANTGVNLLATKEPVSHGLKMTGETFEQFYQNAVDKALDSPNGHLDLFVRFLLGLSLKTNQRLLQGFVTDTEIPSSSIKNITQYIKEKIGGTVCLFLKTNLFYCLNELNDNSLCKEIEQNLKSGNISTEKMSAAQWAALVNIIMSTEDCQETFDLRKYFVIEEAQQGFLPFIINFPKVVLSCCCLNEMSCDLLASALIIDCHILTELDLSNNNIQDSGLKQLCEGLSNPKCELKALRLSGCLITWDGCAVLASALRSNPSHLKELDLSYNHPEESGVAFLSAGLEDPNWALQTLRVEPSGSQFLEPGLSKYAVVPVLDPTTAHRNLTLSECYRNVMVGQEGKVSCSDHPGRFDTVEQVLCKDGLTGRSYWEVEWRGKVSIGVTYKGIPRRGKSDDCSLGMNDQSWSLLCSKDGLSALHNNTITNIYNDSSNKVGVYLDWPGGTVTFFGVSSDKVTFLHSYNTKFTEPVYPAFRIGSDPINSSLTLC